MKYIILMLLCMSAHSMEITGERIDVDPVLVGVWMSTMTSEDKGQTITEQRNLLCRVTAGSVIINANDPPIRVTKVIMFTATDGHNGNALKLDNGWMLISTDSDIKGQKFFQLFNEDNNEVLRGFMTIE